MKFQGGGLPGGSAVAQPAEPDTICIPLDAGRLQGASDAERTELVRDALRARVIRNVDVSVEDGVVRITATPRD